MPTNRVKVHVIVGDRYSPPPPPTLDSDPTPADTVPSAVRRGWPWWVSAIGVLVAFWVAVWAWNGIVVNKSDPTDRLVWNNQPSSTAYPFYGATTSQEVASQPAVEPPRESTAPPTLARGNVPSGGISLPAYTVVLGDVRINGTEMYDSDSNTGLVVILDESANVSADYGASYIETGSLDEARNLAVSFRYSMMTTAGCGGVCGRVSILNWPEDPPQH